jgi:hypothetical protein
MTKEERRKQIEEEAINYRSNPDRSGYTIDTFIDAAEWADKHPKLDFKEIYDWLNTYTDMTFDQLDAFEKEFGPSKPFTCDDCDKIHCSRSQYVMSNCSKLEN